MRSNLQAFASSILAVTLGASLLILASSQAEGVCRPLDAFEMGEIARGAAPSPCATAFKTGTCDDSMSFCASKLLADCTGQVCTSCSLTTVGEQTCDTVKPWNALTCNTLPPVAGGCGTKFTNPTCQWSQAQDKCLCVGQPTTEGCEWRHADSTGVGSCQVQP